MSKKGFINCPNCGYEYLPAEIYLPNEFLGRPREIRRTSEGNIDTFSGTSQNLEETYYCDKCNKPFKISAKIEYTTTLAPELDFSEDYVAPIYKDRIELKEE